MAYAYLVLNRNDIADNLLQVFDIKPNTSQLGIYDSAWANQGGQTGYLTWLSQHDVVATTTGAANIEVTDAAYKGLNAYLIDNVENVQGDGGPNPDLALTDTFAIAIGDAIRDRMSAGGTLTLAIINGLINTACGGLASSDLDGTLPNSYSTGSVEELLRVLAGEVYRVPAAAQVGNADNGFPGDGTTHVPLGAFVASTDSEYRGVRKFANTGSLNLSCLSGNMSKMKAATYSWLNPMYTYGAAGTAVTLDGTHIPATGVAAAVAVYEDDGTLL